MAKQFRVTFEVTSKKSMEILAVDKDDAVACAEKLFDSIDTFVLDRSSSIEKDFSVNQSVDNDDISAWYDYVTDGAREELGLFYRRF